ncbi:MAG: phosphatase PAP2 family protein [bacterium]|nr:phosphatase PAP2 family protein [bacterium]
MPPDTTRRLALVLTATLVGALGAYLLPDIALDTPFADVVVRITDTGGSAQMPWLVMLVLIVVVTRPGLTSKRRGLEAGLLVVATLVALLGGTLLNEHVVKPAFDIARPNIVELAESDALGSGIPDAAAFYAVGNKEARREVLGERLPEVVSPALSDRVRAHWIHETGFSFPSGHSQSAMALTAMMAALGLVWLSGWRRALATIVLPIWAVAVVYSRVLLDVHNAVDTTAGTVMGFAWGLLAAMAALFAMSRGGSPG